MTKLDRLARSLADMSRIVEQLNAKGNLAEGAQRRYRPRHADRPTFLGMLGVFAAGMLLSQTSSPVPVTRRAFFFRPRNPIFVICPTVAAEGKLTSRPSWDKFPTLARPHTASPGPGLFRLQAARLT